MSTITPPKHDPLTRDQLLDILESTAHAQLHALRAFRPTKARARPMPGQEGKSNIAIVEDVLKTAPGPLHIQDILIQAQQRFRRKLSRESLVSALTKKVLDGHTFTRTAPNTFDLLHRP